MGTRGFYGVVIDDALKITYNHFDSYPSGLGVEILKQVTELARDRTKLLSDARRLILVDESAAPTPEQIKELKGFWDPSVSTGQQTEWYSLLRNMQGDLAAGLQAGVMIDSEGFPLDSLFCEWGYLLDLDKGVLEVYEGFQKASPTEGRWAGRPNAEDVQAELDYSQGLLDSNQINQQQFEWRTKPTEYHAVQRVASFDLDDLPDEGSFLTVLEPEDETADA